VWRCCRQPRPRASVRAMSSPYARTLSIGLTVSAALFVSTSSSRAAPAPAGLPGAARLLQKATTEAARSRIGVQPKAATRSAGLLGSRWSGSDCRGACAVRHEPADNSRARAILGGSAGSGATRPVRSRRFPACVGGIVGQRSAPRAPVDCAHPSCRTPP